MRVAQYSLGELLLCCGADCRSLIYRLSNVTLPLARALEKGKDEPAAVGTESGRRVHRKKGQALAERDLIDADEHLSLELADVVLLDILSAEPETLKPCVDRCGRRVGDSAFRRRQCLQRTSSCLACKFVAAAQHGTQSLSSLGPDRIVLDI